MNSATNWKVMMAGAVLALGWSTQVAAQLPDPEGPTDVGQHCMQKVFGTPVVNANRLGCTASDIKIAEAIETNVSTCVAGEPFNLKGTFKVDVTANIRYDVGFFFRLDGNNARGDGAAAQGSCSLSRPDPTVKGAQSSNLDGDTCGDLRAGQYLMKFDIPGAICQDTDGNGLLNLPNCTSWHSNAGTACQIGDPFTFNPETKSKCNCDDAFNVPIQVIQPAVSVDKTATPNSVNELGDAVTFTVSIKNDATLGSVIISRLDDKLPNGQTVNLLTIPACVGGSATSANRGPCTHGTAAVACPALAGAVLAAQEMKTCSFQMYLSGNAGATLTDTVTGCANGACDEASANVVVTDLASEPSVTKTATAVGCRVDASYDVNVNNPSQVDTLTINTLLDDRFGDITQVHAASNGIEEVLSTTCNAAKGTTIPVAGNYACSFTGRITSGDCSIHHVNTVTADVTDDDGVDSMPSDSATVSVTSTKN